MPVIASFVQESLSDSTSYYHSFLWPPFALEFPDVVNPPNRTNRLDQTVRILNKTTQQHWHSFNRIKREGLQLQHQTEIFATQRLIIIIVIQSFANSWKRHFDHAMLTWLRRMTSMTGTRLNVTEQFPERNHNRRLSTQQRCTVQYALNFAG